MKTTTMTKRKLFFLLLLSMPSSLLFGQYRQDSLINFNWKFIQQPITGAQLNTFNDKDWQTVQLPHDASIYGPFLNDSLNSDRKNGFRPRLKGWYRKKLDMGKLSGSNRFFLEFEGFLLILSSEFSRNPFIT